jgi:hypothetical protein
VISRKVIVTGITIGRAIRRVRPESGRPLTATPDEVARVLPGDDLVARPTLRATRAVTIAAPAERIEPGQLVPMSLDGK